MRITFVPMVAMMVASVMHVPLCLIFLNGLDLGILGLAYALSVKDGVLLVSVMIYARCKTEIRAAMRGLDAEAFRGWGEYLSYSLPCVLMICSEWWAFEILQIFAGALGVDELAAATIALNLTALPFMAIMGF